MRKLFCSLLLPVALLGPPTPAPAQSEPKPPTPKSKAMVAATALWRAWADQNLKAGDSEQNIRATLAPKAKDWGRVNYGGTGNYSLRFKVDDLHQIQVDFELSGKMVSATVARTKEDWIKDPDGNLVEIIPR